RPRGGGDDGNRHRPRDRLHLRARLGARRRRRGDVRAPRAHERLVRLHRRPEGVHRRRDRWHRLDSGRDGRWADPRLRRGVLAGLHLDEVVRPDRLLDPHRLHDLQAPGSPGPGGHPQGMSDSTPHGSRVPAEGPAVGQDEWVARHAERRLMRGGVLGSVEERLRRVPWWAWLVLFVAAFSLLPVFEGSGYVRRVAFDTVLYMLLALGLNVVVGWGGLLDLGYVAFYGIGAYAYALLDSDKFGVHLPSLVAVPLIVVIGAVAGLLLGLPSRRLSGDYLAIVTLFFL